jgi:hypothetical protein
MSPPLRRETPSARPTIQCPVCGLRSAHPSDIEYGYCANCHAYTSAACDLSPDIARHASRRGRCLLCMHRPEQHPHEGTVDLRVP